MVRLPSAALSLVFVFAACVVAASTACSTAGCGPDLPPLDARWVGSLYHGTFGSAEVYLARISDLVDSGQIEVIAHDAGSRVDPGSGQRPTLLLAGKPDALALAQERIAGQGTRGGQMRGAIGVALCMPGKERRTMAEPLLSVVLLPDLDGLEAVFAFIRAANERNWVGGFPEFRSGKPAGTRPRTLLVAEAGWDDLRLLTQALHKTEVPFCGFVQCEFVHLWSAPF